MNLRSEVSSLTSKSTGFTKGSLGMEGALEITQEMEITIFPLNHEWLLTGYVTFHVNSNYLIIKIIFI